MDRRKFLSLLRGAGIGLMVGPMTTPDLFATSNAQSTNETEGLVKKIATYLIEERRIKIGLPVGYGHCSCSEYVDRTTGKDASEKMKGASAADWANFYELGPDKVLPNIVQRLFNRNHINIEGPDFAVDVETKVYRKDNTSVLSALNFDDPNNYLKISWFNGRWTHFTDKGLDGVVDECSNPLIDRQRIFMQYLRRIEQMYAQSMSSSNHNLFKTGNFPTSSWKV